jgi:hypothetical protein
MINPRTEIADVARLYEEAEADHALIEIELDTQLLRAITTEEAAAILESAALEPHTSNVHSIGYNPAVSESLEQLLRLSWPVWKAS